MNSCLYECRVMHHRFAPKEHKFCYRIFMLYLDLDELPQLQSKLWLFGRNHLKAYEFRDTDHLLYGANEVKEGINRYLQGKGVAETYPQVSLLTLPRVFGYIFNPVSFYYCRNSSGDPLCAVAEVGNTFAEKKPFLIQQRAKSGWRQRHIKHFYVSPFFNHNLEFDFHLQEPKEKLAIAVDDYEGEQRVLHTTLTGERRALTDMRLAWFTFKYPLLTLQVIAGIHWEALRLWWKGLAYHGKAAFPDLQRDVYPAAQTSNQSSA